jgi:hypothetical protein
MSASAVAHRPDGFEVTRTLDPRRDHYLNDHRIDGRPVLPFAMALELMAEVAATGWPGHELVNLREIRMLRGIVLESDSLTVRVSAKVVAGAAQPDSGQGELQSVELSISPSESPNRIHYRAFADLKAPGESDALDPHAVALAKIPEIEDARPLPISLDEAYGEWLFHGPLFQGIASLESIGLGGASSLLRTSSPHACVEGDVLGNWVIDPVVLDSAFQVQLIWARLHWDVTLLPLMLRGYRRLSLTVNEPRGQGARPNSASRDRVKIIRHEMRMRPENQAPLSNADHYFFDHKGRPIAVVSGAEAAGSKALNRIGRAAQLRSIS